jgi:hypothetical protein
MGAATLCCCDFKKRGQDMRTLFLAGVLISLVTTPALACRGTVEFSAVADGITQSTLTPERKKELLDQLSVGDALHKKAHREGDMMIMEESLGIIDGIKVTFSLEVD